MSSSFAVDVSGDELVRVSRQPPAHFDEFLRNLPSFVGEDEKEKHESMAVPEDNRLCVDAKGRLWCLREDQLFYVSMGARDKDRRIRKVHLYQSEGPTSSSSSSSRPDEKGIGGSYTLPGDCFAVTVNAECSAVLVTATERCFVVQVPSNAFEESVFGYSAAGSAAVAAEDQKSSSSSNGVVDINCPVVELGSVFLRPKIAMTGATPNPVEDPECSVIQAAFHPNAPRYPYVGVLYSDFRFSLYRVRLGSTVSEPERLPEDAGGPAEFHFSVDNDSVNPECEVTISGFSFGCAFSQSPSASIDFVWNSMTVYFLLENGALCALCPVVVPGMELPLKQVVNLYNHCLTSGQGDRAEWLSDTFQLSRESMEQEFLSVHVGSSPDAAIYWQPALQGPCGLRWGVTVPVNEFTSFCSGMHLLPSTAPPTRLVVACEPDSSSNREQAMVAVIAQTRTLRAQWQGFSSSHDEPNDLRNVFTSVAIHPLSPPSSYVSEDEEAKSLFSLCRILPDALSNNFTMIHTPWASYGLDLTVLEDIQRRYAAEEGSEQEGDIIAPAKPKRYHVEATKEQDVDCWMVGARGAVLLNDALMGRYLVALGDDYELNAVRVPLYTPPSLRITGRVTALDDAKHVEEDQPSQVWPNKALFKRVDDLLGKLRGRKWDDEAAHDWDTQMETDYAKFMGVLQDMSSVRTELFTASRCLREAETSLKIEFKRQDAQAKELVTTIDELKEVNGVLVAQIEANQRYNDGLQNHVDSFMAMLDESEPPSRQEQEFSKRVALFASKKVPLLENAVKRLSTHAQVTEQLRNQVRKQSGRDEGAMQPSDRQLTLVFPVLEEQVLRLNKLKGKMQQLLERLQ